MLCAMLGPLYILSLIPKDLLQGLSCAPRQGPDNEDVNYFAPDHTASLELRWN